MDEYEFIKDENGQSAEPQSAPGSDTENSAAEPTASAQAEAAAEHARLERDQAEAAARAEAARRAAESYRQEQARIAELARRQADYRRAEEERKQEAEKAAKKAKRKKTWKIIGIVAAVLAAVALCFALAYWATRALNNFKDSLEDLRSSYASSSSENNESEPMQSSESRYHGETYPSASVDPSIPAAETRENSQGKTILTDVSDIVEENLPAVVCITNTYTVTSSSFYGTRKYESVSAGSGIIIGDNGYELWIATNNHVIEDSEKLEVTFVDGETYEVYLKGADAENDLAVIGVSLANLKEETRSAIRTIVLGSSEKLRLGEGVIAIGNAMGWGQSVTTGVVSGLNREVEFEDGTKMFLLQTSAAINPGNSGGALLNCRGELVGINNAKYSDTDVEGVGFAIPISSVLEIMDELALKEPRIPVSEEDYPYIGVSFQDYSTETMAAYGMPSGALIYSVSEKTPAEEAGLLAWDVITAIDDVKIRSYDDLTEELQYYKGGTEITLTISRMNQGRWQEQKIKLQLGFKKDYVN